MSPHAEAFNTLLLSSKKLVAHVYNLHDDEPRCADPDDQLHRLEEKLASFDPEKIYATIQDDLEEKYQLAADYYADLDSTRDNLLNEEKLDAVKEENYKTDLRNKLDQVVNTLRTDFNAYIDKSYALYDVLFMLFTNKFTQKELTDLDDKVTRCLETADTIYDEEYRKIERIYDLLEEEGMRLNKTLGVE